MCCATGHKHWHPVELKATAASTRLPQCLPGELGASEAGTVTALALASGVAVASGALSALTWRVDGHTSTALSAYPFAVTAAFRPPVVAALSRDPRFGLVERSDDIAYPVTNEGPDPPGVVPRLEANFERRDEDHVVIRSVVLFPVGRALGLS